MPVKVHLRQLRISPRKVRLVVDVIRGMKVDEAMDQLEYIPKRSSSPVLKLLKSAVAAAENDFKMNKEDLYISKIIVDEGPILKRSMPHAMGRAFPIMKRTSCITIVLDKKAEVLKETGESAADKDNDERIGNKEKKAETEETKKEK